MEQPQPVNESSLIPALPNGVVGIHIDIRWPLASLFVAPYGASCQQCPCVPSDICCAADYIPGLGHHAFRLSLSVLVVGSDAPIDSKILIMISRDSYSDFINLKNMQA